MEVRRAHPDEAPALSDLAYRSKALWGYSPEFMEACRAELTLTPEDIRAHPVFVAELSGDVLGFHALKQLASDRIDLWHLFVDPARVRLGVGRRLLTHARQHARELGYRTLVIQSDPQAEGFYAGCGAVRVGDLPSESIPGRVLPLMEIALRT
jgi:GNAT superfamily N-acetyltransferase